MNEKRIDSFIYEGLGFPIRLIDVPLKKIFGEWVLDVNFGALQKDVLKTLAKQPTPLTCSEIRFIMDYLEMSSREFAKLFGVTHAAVLKWENGKSKMNPSTELHLRMYILNYLKVTDKEFRKVYLNMNLRNLSNRHSQNIPIEIDINQMAC